MYRRKDHLFYRVCILMVNANVFANPFGDGAIYIDEVISAVVGTIPAGIMFIFHLVQAGGMGLNAFFEYAVCIGFGLSYAGAMVLILQESIVFILLTVAGLKKEIFDSLPDVVRASIPSGIGLFIAMLLLTH